jgi:hypothetical protein
MKEQFLGFLSKTLNMDIERLSEILFKKADDGKTLTDQIAENALEELLKLDADRATKLKGEVDTKKIADDQYKRGQKEALENLEKTLRGEFKTDSTAQGLDLVKHLVSQAATKKLGEDEVKIHPLYLSLEERAKKEAEALKTDLEKQFADLKNGYERKDRFGKVSTEAILPALDALRPILPSNPSAASNVRQLFLDRFVGYDYEPSANGGWVLMKDGKRVENSHGHPVTIAELVQQEAGSLFDFQKQEQKGSAGNGSGTGASAQRTAVAVPKTEEEYYTAYLNESTVEGRQALDAAWGASKGAASGG